MATRAGDRRGTDRSGAVILSPGIKLGMLIPPQPSDDDLRFANELGVTFRNVSAPLPRFHETFVDEGYQDMHVLMRLFHDGGYRGTMVLDHTPPMAHDPNTAHSGPADRPVATAYAIGYMKALLAAAAG